MYSVFVYGTLLRGLRNHALLTDATFVRACTTVDRFTLLDFDRYPAVVAVPKYPIVGELYSVSDATLARLDELEGYPHWYDRMEVALEGGPAGETAWMYVFNHPPETEGVQHRELDGGSWMNMLRRESRLAEQRPGGLWAQRLAAEEAAEAGLADGARITGHGVTSDESSPEVEAQLLETQGTHSTAGPAPGGDL